MGFGILISYSNPEPERLGDRIITSVTVWIPEGCYLPVLAWTINAYSAGKAQAIQDQFHATAHG